MVVPTSSVQETFSLKQEDGSYKDVTYNKVDVNGNIVTEYQVFKRAKGDKELAEILPTKIYQLGDDGRVVKETTQRYSERGTFLETQSINYDLGTQKTINQTKGRDGGITRPLTMSSGPGTSKEYITIDQYAREKRTRQDNLKAIGKQRLSEESAALGIRSPGPQYGADNKRLPNQFTAQGANALFLNGVQIRKNAFTETSPGFASRFGEAQSLMEEERLKAQEEYKAQNELLNSQRGRKPDRLANLNLYYNLGKEAPLFPKEPGKFLELSKEQFSAPISPFEQLQFLVAPKDKKLELARDFGQRISSSDEKARLKRIEVLNDNLFGDQIEVAKIYRDASISEKIAFNTGGSVGLLRTPVSIVKGEIKSYKEISLELFNEPSSAVNKARLVELKDKFTGEFYKAQSARFQSKEKYDSFNAKYNPYVVTPERLATGKKIDELNKDPDVRNALVFNAIFVGSQIAPSLLAADVRYGLSITKAKSLVNRGVELSTIPFAYKSVKETYANPTPGNVGDSIIFGVGGTAGLKKAVQEIAFERVLRNKQFVPAEKVFDQSTREFGGKETFPRSTSVKAILADFKATRTKTVNVAPYLRQTDTLIVAMNPKSKPTFLTPNYAVKISKIGASQRGGFLRSVHSSPAPLAGNKVIDIVPRNKAEQPVESVGLNVAPYGRGSPYFLRTSGESGAVPSLFPDFGVRRPTGQVILSRGIEVIPDAVARQPGYAAEAAYLKTRGNSGLLFIDKRTLLAYDKSLKPLKGTMKGTTETQAVVPEGAGLKMRRKPSLLERIAGYRAGFKQYTIVQGDAVALPEFVQGGKPKGKVQAARYAEGIKAFQKSVEDSVSYSKNKPTRISPSYAARSSSRSAVSSIGSSPRGSSSPRVPDFSTGSPKSGRSRSPSGSSRGVPSSGRSGSYGYRTGSSSGLPSVGTSGGSSGKSIKITTPPPTTITTYKRFKIPGLEPSKKKRPDVRLPGAFKPVYNKSVEALLFNIRGPKPSAGLVSTGLVVRPIVR